MVVAQGQIWWADLGEPTRSEPGFRRPVIVAQGDALTRSKIGTVICVALTSNVRWVEAPGNVLLSRSVTGLEKDSVASVSQIMALDRNVLLERVGKVPMSKLELILSGIDVVL